MAKILACIDGSIYSHSVCDLAAWAASRMSQPIELLHVLGRREVSTIPVDISGTLVAYSQDILAELAAMDEQRASLSQRRGRLILDEGRGRLKEAGATNVESHLYNGDLVETLGEFESETSLIVIGKRGEAADFAKLHLGSNLERVARATKKPVLVAARAFKPIQRFLIAFDGGPSVMKAVDMIAAGQLLRGLEGHLLMAGNPDDESKNRLAAAETKLREAGWTISARILPGEPEAVIAAEVEKASIDLLVMGAYGHSRIRSLIIGSTTTAMVRSCLIPVLMLR
jgi:nucleotide-binding universal stress UspA family protein